jgi:hypothetical protein
VGKVELIKGGPCGGPNGHSGTFPASGASWPIRLLWLTRATVSMPRTRNISMLDNISQVEGKMPVPGTTLY